MKPKYAFLALAAVVIGFAVYDYRMNSDSDLAKIAANRLFPDRVVEDTESFTIKNFLNEIKIVRVEQDKVKLWKMELPKPENADQAGIDSYLTNVLNHDAKMIETDGEPKWNDYGLDKPDASIEIKFRDGRASLIEIGTVKAVGDGYYLRKDKSNELLLGTSDWGGLLNRPSADFKEKPKPPSDKGPAKGSSSEKKP